ncbi:MAG: hypothetical protein ACTHU0_06310 [Kofleriaceae bacterium]
MRLLSVVLVVLVAFAACAPPARTQPDAAPSDAPDVPDEPDAIDAPRSNGIAEARASFDASGLELPITDVIVTHVRPRIGNSTEGPAGFTIQVDREGPALFVSVDPATLTPPPTVGDVVSFEIYTLGTVERQRRAQEITNYVRTATGADVDALLQDVSNATDLLSAIEDYDAELVTMSGGLAGFDPSFNGFKYSWIATPAIPAANDNLQLRVTDGVADEVDAVEGCRVTVSRVPLGRTDEQVQLQAYAASELQLSGCWPPNVVEAVTLSATSVRFAFDRRVLPSSVLPDGSQFTFDHGLTATAATVSGRTVTVTTTPQLRGTTYTGVVASSVTDLLGSGVVLPNAKTFPGHVTRAVVRINELNTNIADGCNLLELRVVSGGSMAGFELTTRGGTFLYAPDVTVATNDLIVVHLRQASCNPGGSISETTSMSEQPSSMFPANYDSALDWYSDVSLGTQYTVLAIRDPAGIVDALFVTQDPTATGTNPLNNSAAALVGMANQWSPALPSYEGALFHMHAVADLDATGTTRTGTSIQRLDDTDDNDKADWSTGPGLPETWGKLNAGQTPL